MDRTLARNRQEESRTGQKRGTGSRGGWREGNKRGEDGGERCLWSNRGKGEVRKTPGMRRGSSEEVLMLQDGDGKWLAGQDTPWIERGSDREREA